MDPPTDPLLRTVMDGSAAADAGVADIGPEIGRYLVIDQIGAGGMGRVFRAYDPKLGREVALKRLHVRVGPRSNDGARMLREAKAMAQLAHPNVVSVFDVDLDHGALFIAMEYVEGVTLRTWLRRRAPSWRAVLGMFVQAGRGLAAAHAQGIVHRDFKPANVIVGTDGRARVMDFGLARAASDDDSGIFDAVPDAFAPRVEGDDGDAVIDVGDTLTADGTVVGTPPYMAPEQHVAEPVDARTDQYAFCVSLWEALYGAVPFTGRDLGELAAAKLMGSPKAPTGARVPAALQAVLQRGLQPRPEHRWPDMDALLDELQRRTMPRRWGAPVALAAVAAVAGVLWWQRAPACSDVASAHAQVFDDDARARVDAALSASRLSYAADTRTRVLASLDAWSQAWAQAHVEACEATRVHHEQSDEALDLRMACLRARAGELNTVTDLLAAGDDAVLERAVELTLGLGPLEGCADASALRERTAPGDSPQQRAAIDDVRARLEQARLQSRAGRHEAALELAEQARADALAIDHPPLHAEAELAVGMLLDALDRPEPARASFERALDTALAHRAQHTAASAAVELTSLLSNENGSAEPSMWLARTALGLAQGDGSDPRLVADAMLVYGEVFADRELELEAEPYFAGALTQLEQAVGPEHPDLIGVLIANAQLLHVLGRIEQCNAYLQRALAIAEAAFGPDHPKVASALTQLGWSALGDGHIDEALADFDRGLAIVEAAYGPNHDRVWSMMGMRATALGELGRLDEAASATEEALRRMDGRVPEAHPARASTLHNLAHIYSLQGDHSRAAATLRETVRLRRIAGNRGLVAAGLGALGRELVALAQWSDAEAVLREASTLEAASHADDGAYFAFADIELANVLLHAGRREEARGLLETALGKMGPDAFFIGRPEAEFRLAQILWELPAERHRAVALAEAALARMPGIPPNYRDEQEQEIRTWLDQHTLDDPESILVPAPTDAVAPR
ncbi:MAG: tetratricopeptide repeat protein [Deltaproteobacteria bacterium]|nr:tetratricopeptide repeat protein [Deltaproteobacteria bacterium]MBP7286318.1 tetratricopeptide repeat protein [Nannocystaceae bacterium]